MCRKEQNQIAEKLFKICKDIRKNAYAPYSNFKVSAAILTKEDKIFTGVNVENISYGLTICAERVAIFKAVSEGYKDFKAIGILCEADNFCTPCGACRQVIAEFSNNLDVYMFNLNGDYKKKNIKELLPESFKSEKLQSKEEK